MKYNFAVRVRNCDDKKYCIFRDKKSKGKKKKDSGEGFCSVHELLRCPLPIKLNPACVAKSANSCMKLFDIHKYKDDYYIFYRCNYCEYFLDVSRDDLYNKILEPLNSEDIYYGRDLKKLIKLVIPTSIEDTDISCVIDYFVKIFDEVSSGG